MKQNNQVQGINNIKEELKSHLHCRNMSNPDKSISPNKAKFSSTRSRAKAASRLMLNTNKIPSRVCQINFVFLIFCRIRMNWQVKGTQLRRNIGHLQV